jgi:hypothetical protein
MCSRAKSITEHESNKRNIGHPDKQSAPILLRKENIPQVQRLVRALSIKPIFVMKYFNDGRGFLFAFLK